MTQRYVPVALRRLVQERAGGCCEYCLFPEDLAFLPHEVDHVIAQKHGGETHIDNLAWSCALCNKYKGSDLASIDPETGKLEPLFNPRLHLWSEHFELVGATLVSRTPTGRVTTRLLQLNHPSRLLERSILADAGFIPVRKPFEKTIAQANLLHTVSCPKPSPKTPQA